MYQQIVILTGAGISAESGIETFRAEDGLWAKHRIEDVATPEGYWRSPSLVHRFYNGRLAQLQQGIEPNAAHRALAELAEHLGTEKLLLVTQNIDDLHERAGSTQVLHMHGELLKARCPNSQQVFKGLQPFGEDNRCPCCVPSYVLRPHVVWFGEMPLELESIYEALSRCDLFISIGTSGTVYPAAGFVEEAHKVGAETVSINVAAAENLSQFQYHRQGKASILVPALVSELLTGQRLQHAAGQ